MPSGRRNYLLAGLIAVVVVVASAVIFFAPKPPSTSTTPIPGPTYAAPAAAPTAAVSPASESIADLVDNGWLVDTSKRTGIPVRALSAYAGAALWKAKQMPTCGISWNTLAAIGFVESKHGTYDGSSIGSDGKITPAIYGVALDGVTSVHIPDSDKGEFDNDATFDRAIGPMQMIPQTWRNWRTDANADHKRDPQNMYDAVMAAANYLCRASPDMVGVDGWKAGIASYNNAPSYLIAVARAAIEYGGTGS